MPLTKITLHNGALFNSSQAFLGADSLFTTGTVFFVNSVTGSNDNNGTDPSTPKGTIQGAVSASTANKGDKIICMPGHAETVTATSINISKAGVSVICIGTGLERPTFTYGAAAATITVSAANCGFVGGVLVANFVNVVSAFTVGAGKDFKCLSNTFIDTSSILNFLSQVVTGSVDNDADGLEFSGNNVYSLPATANAVVSILAAEKRVIIADNFANKAATNDAGQFITLAAKIVTGIQISRNRLIVVGASGALVGIFLTGSGSTSTGVLENNYVASLDATTELIMTASTGLRTFENYYQGVADKNGKLFPVVNA